MLALAAIPVAIAVVLAAARASSLLEADEVGRAGRVRARPDRDLARRAGPASASSGASAARGERLVRDGAAARVERLYLAVAGGVALGFYGLLVLRG